MGNGGRSQFCRFLAAASTDRHALTPDPFSAGTLKFSVMKKCSNSPGLSQQLSEPLKSPGQARAKM
jgi:hypothetical protein